MSTLITGRLETHANSMNVPTRGVQRLNPNDTPVTSAPSVALAVSMATIAIVAMTARG